MSDIITLKRIKDHDAVATATDVGASSTQIPIDDAGYSEGKIISALELNKGLADVSEANPTAGVVATLDGTGKLKASQRSSTPTDYVGTWDPETNTPTLTDAGGSDGQMYRIAIVSGAASYARDLGGGSITWTNGGDAIHNGSEFELSPGTANVLDGQSTASGGRNTLSVYSQAETNDRTLSAQPANSIILGNNGYLDPGAAYPGTNPLRDKFTALLTVRFHSFPASGDAQVTMITAGGLASSSTNGGIQIEADGTIDVNHYDGGFDNLLDILGGAAELGKVYCIAYRMDSANDGLTVFVDGVKGSSVASGVGTVTTGRWVLGCNDEDNSGTEVINFRPFNRVLSDAQVAFYSKNQGVKIEDQWGGADLSVNGGFETWGGAVPDSWTKGSAVTIAKETTDVQEGSNAVDLTGGGNITSSSNNWLKPTTASIPRDKGVRVRAKVKNVSAGTLDLGTTYYRILSWDGTTVTEDAASGWSTQYPNGTIYKTSATLIGSGWYQLELEVYHSSTGNVDLAIGGTGQWLIDDVEIDQVGAVVALLPENITSDGSIRDASSNGLHAAGTSTTSLRKQQILSIDAESPAADSKLIEVKNSGSEVFSVDEDGDIAELSVGDESELTIATGAITVTSSYHTVDTESDAASDDLDTVNGTRKGQIVFIRANNSARSVVAKDGTGNLKLAGDFTMDNAEDVLQLISDGTNLYEVSRSNNGA